MPSPEESERIAREQAITEALDDEGHMGTAARLMNRALNDDKVLEHLEAGSLTPIDIQLIAGMETAHNYTGRHMGASVAVGREAWRLVQERSRHTNKPSAETDETMLRTADDILGEYE